MTIRKPVVVTDGYYLQLQDGDTIEDPETTNFTYSGSQLTQVTTATGTINMTYSAGKVATAYNSKTGKTATFTYNAGKLSCITITP